MKQINKPGFSGQDLYVGIDTGKKVGRLLFLQKTLSMEHLLKHHKKIFRFAQNDSKVSP